MFFNAKIGAFLIHRVDKLNLSFCQSPKPNANKKKNVEVIYSETSPLLRSDSLENKSNHHEVNRQRIILYIIHRIISLPYTYCFMKFCAKIDKNFQGDLEHSHPSNHDHKSKSRDPRDFTASGRFEPHSQSMTSQRNKNIASLKPATMFFLYLIRK